jgi:hypothetical protein
MNSVKVIGNGAFMYCPALQTVIMENVEIIGDYAFGHFFNGNGPNKALTAINIPKVTSIGNSAFQHCEALQAVYMDDVQIIGDSAFGNCIALQTVSANNVQTIGNSAFGMCTALQKITLTKAESIGDSAFGFCRALEEIRLPAVTGFGQRVFEYTSSQSLTIILGNAVPATGTNLFTYFSSSEDRIKNVTVKVPAAALNYGASPTDTTTDNWGNAFRGKGWDGTNYLNGNINENIILTIETY